MRVFFTGGSGKAGRHAVAYLRAQGHHVINADQTLSGDGTNELQVDLMDFGQVIINSMPFSLDTAPMTAIAFVSNQLIFIVVFE